MPVKYVAEITKVVDDSRRAEAVIVLAERGWREPRHSE